MKIAITFEDREDSIGIEISNEMTLEDLSAYIEAEVDVTRDKQLLYHNNTRLQGLKHTLASLGVGDGDMLVLRTQSTTVQGQSFDSANDRLEMLRQQIINDLNLQAQLRSSDPQLFEQISSPDNFKEVMMTRLQSQMPSFGVQDQEMQKLEQNPDDPENQKKIMEMIRKQQIQDNLQLAYDISPESFINVNMLYIKLRINGHETYALVDSGAQQTILHPKLAEDFGILRLVDDRYASMTLGVGTAKSDGRIHSVPVSLGDTNLEVPCSFTVVETHVGILLGLDMLRRHKCSIDLSQDALLIGDRKVPFLNESEIAKNVKFLDTLATNSLKPSEGASKERHPTTQENLTSITVEGNSTREDIEFPMSDISQLQSLGFTKEEALAALKATQGNVELAASMLFQ